MPGDSSNTPNKPRQRWILPLLAVLFMGPLVAAWLLYFSASGWRPGGQVNHGLLIQTATAVPAVPQAEDGRADPPVFRDTWTIVVAGGERCQEQCMAMLDKTRRVRLALREKAPRVRRVLLYSPSPAGVPEAFADEDTGLTLLSVVDSTGRMALDVFDKVASKPPSAWAVFIVDPLGNIIMMFEPDFEMRGMLADLKRLLRLSRIG